VCKQVIIQNILNTLFAVFVDGTFTQGRTMPPHVTLVNPPYPKGAHQHPPFTPLGLGYLAAILLKNKYKVDVIDCQVLNTSYKEVKQKLIKRKPDIVGITSTTLTYKSALQIAKIAKELNPNCLTILGGCHATFWDNKVFQDSQYIDIIVRGEGEQTILELVDRFEKDKPFHDVLGITCKNGKEIVQNPLRPYIEDLDSLPFPAHHLWQISHLKKYGKVIFPVMTSRGCTFWCEFCTAVRMFGRRYRARSPKNVVDELEFLQKNYGAEQFTFYDDTFTVNQARTAEICEEIIKRNLKIEWDCETRVDMVSKELLQKMKKAGCFAVWYGLESGSQKLLNAMGKGISLNQVLRAFKWTKDVGLMAVVGVILGSPNETKETAWETIEFVERLNPDDVGYYIATPYPGTPMYDAVKEKGWLRVTDFDRYDTATPIFELPSMTMQELREIREEAFHRFYLRPQYFLNMLTKGRFWSLSIGRTVLAHFLRAVKAKIMPRSRPKT
jgi:anaerobic magnesium-protoporphyrin IX monomethyl ester cyclase